MPYPRRFHQPCLGHASTLAVVMMGLGLPDDNAHAPNEKLHLPTCHRGLEAVIHFLSLMRKGED